jgi:hypothetical protein
MRNKIFDEYSALFMKYCESATELWWKTICGNRFSTTRLVRPAPVHGSKLLSQEPLFFLDKHTPGTGRQPAAVPWQLRSKPHLDRNPDKNNLSGKVRKGLLTAHENNCRHLTYKRSAASLAEGWTEDNTADGGCGGRRQRLRSRHREGSADAATTSAGVATPPQPERAQAESAAAAAWWANVGQIQVLHRSGTIPLD